MSVTEYLARGCTFELNTTGSTWVAVGGINTFTHAHQAADADTTTFDDDGRKSHMKASRGDQFTLTGLDQEDPSTGAQDAGQAAVEAWGALIGPDSVKNFRITTPGGRVREFAATASVNAGGGGNDAASAWSATITVTGALSNSALPAAPAAPTSVTATEGDTVTLIDFTDSATGSPTAYEVVIYDGASEVKRVESSEFPIYVSGLTNGTEYTAKVRAFNAGGWSDLSTASSAFTPTGS